MKKLAFGALFVGLFAAACGGGGGGGADARMITTTDGALPDGSAAACNVVAQTGCDAGEKCTWIRVAASSTQQLGQLGCVPDGSVALNGACAYMAAGTATGYDNCQKGLICLASSSKDMATGSCQTICDLSALAPAAGACPTGYGCGSYVDFFANGTDSAVAGVCDPTCDPVTQVRDSDGAAACGSSMPSDPEFGCYGGPSRSAKPSEFRCANGPATATTPGQKLPEASAYINSCSPGFVPLFYASSTDMNNVVCTAFCQPADTNTSTPGNAGGKPNSGHTCQDAGHEATFECRYMWWYEGATTPLSKASHLGVCFDYSQYTYDDDQNAATPPVPRPSCTTLAPGAGTTVAQAQDWGCEDVTVRPAFKAQSASPLRVYLTDVEVDSLLAKP